jgi:hypothetical protein
VVQEKTTWFVVSLSALFSEQRKVCGGYVAFS